MMHYETNFPDQFMENMKRKKQLQLAFLRGTLFGGGIVAAVFLYFVI